MESTSAVPPQSPAAGIGNQQAGAIADAFAALTALPPDGDHESGRVTATDSVFVLATIEQGGYIAIEDVAAVQDAAESAPDFTSQQSGTDTPTGKSTRAALEQLQQRDGLDLREGAAPIDSGEGGFIELAVTHPAQDVRRHPLLDDQTRQHRSSEADASIGRLVVFDSAGPECWKSVAATYSMAYDATAPDASVADTPATTSAASTLLTACGTGALLTSSEVIRRRWGNPLSRMLQFLRSVLSRR